MYKVQLVNGPLDGSNIYIEKIDDNIVVNSKKKLISDYVLKEDGKKAITLKVSDPVEFSYIVDIDKKSLDQYIYTRNEEVDVLTTETESEKSNYEIERRFYSFVEKINLEK